LYIVVSYIVVHNKLHIILALRVTRHEIKKGGVIMALHTCKTCGAVAPDTGHLCEPVEANKIYVCDYCGEKAAQKAHLCKPKLTKISYYCEACGRSAVKEDELCKPRVVEG